MIRLYNAVCSVFEAYAENMRAVPTEEGPEGATSQVELDGLDDPNELRAGEHRMASKQKIGF